MREIHELLDKAQSLIHDRAHNDEADKVAQFDSHLETLRMVTDNITGQPHAAPSAGDEN